MLLEIFRPGVYKPYQIMLPPPDQIKVRMITKSALRLRTRDVVGATLVGLPGFPAGFRRTLFYPFSRSFPYHTPVSSVSPRHQSSDPT